jgi:ATP-dependent DNA helicase RecG
MAGAHPMHRLLQGDVGSGKTLVAAAAIWACIRNGYQAALMAPTEILASQHAEGLNKLLAPFGIRVALLTGGMKAAAKRTTLAAIREDQADLVVGTHAILSEGVEFARLGLAVIDEQHRFGVRQRGLLAEKGNDPHLLVMSATPIPRTLGLLIYGDLDISVLDELPPGRTPVKTRCLNGAKRRDLYGFLDAQIDAGRQVYIVCPAIEDTPDGGLNAVKTYYEDTAKAYLPGRRVGLMHGKLKPKEKATVMEDFKAGRLDALVSTTVIEVGVDVPNATVMVIENAERYGLSALHQLRGRVGRGAQESWCFLISDHPGESVHRRLRFLCGTSDGFAVAQYDLETRGPGDFFGSRQHGLPTLQIADLMNDTRTLHAAQSEALAMLAEDPQLKRPEHALLAQQVERMFAQAGAMN